MSTQTPAYLTGNFTVTDGLLMAEYTKQVTPLMHKYGGKVVMIDHNVVPEEGKAGATLVIIEFPDLKAAQGFYHDPQYAPIRDLRINATEGGFLALSPGLPISM